MKEDVIRQVKEAENQSEEKIREAQAQADKIIRDARHQAVELRLKIVDAARAKSKQVFETGAKEFEPELENIQQTFKNEIATDTEQAQKRIEKVIDFVVMKFNARLGSSG